MLLDKERGAADGTGEIVSATLLQPVSQAAQVVDVPTWQHLCCLHDNTTLISCPQLEREQECEKLLEGQPQAHVICHMTWNRPMWYDVLCRWIHFGVVPRTSLS